MSEIFPAKLLLFGEYTVLLGGSALAIPEFSYYGKWEIEDSPSNRYEKIFREWWGYLEKNIPQIDALALAEDWEKGFRFSTNIPAGYGLGSSGVLSAIVMHYYGYPSIKSEGLNKIRSVLARMESFFHGTSSGLDPLVSYFKKAFYAKDGEFIPLESSIDLKDWTYHLVDSGKARETSKWVATFQERMTIDMAFKEKVKDLYLPAVDRIIASTLHDPGKDWESELKFISQFQREHFHWLLPPNIQKQWDEKIENRYFKICGAGGGGFFLSFEKKTD
jgi:mevalonate kinase